MITTSPRFLLILDLLYYLVPASVLGLNNWIFVGAEKVGYQIR
jgi:hypothetical protein